MPAPLANQFSHFEVGTHLDDWVAWAYANQVDERIIAFLRFRPELLFDFDLAHNPVAFPSPRSWEFAHRSLQKFEGHPDLLRGTLQTCVGPAASIELHAFVDNLDQMPDPDAILAGEEVPVPTEIDLQYAVLPPWSVGPSAPKETPPRRSSAISELCRTLPPTGDGCHAGLRSTLGHRQRSVVRGPRIRRLGPSGGGYPNRPLSGPPPPMAVPSQTIETSSRLRVRA